MVAPCGASVAFGSRRLSAHRRRDRRIAHVLVSSCPTRRSSDPQVDRGTETTRAPPLGHVTFGYATDARSENGQSDSFGHLDGDTPCLGNDWPDPSEYDVTSTSLLSFCARRGLPDECTAGDAQRGLADRARRCAPGRRRKRLDLPEQVRVGGMASASHCATRSASICARRPARRPRRRLLCPTPEGLGTHRSSRHRRRRHGPCAPARRRRPSSATRAEAEADRVLGDSIASKCLHACSCMFKHSAVSA
jgi:hypothetical protein